MTQQDVPESIYAAYRAAVAAHYAADRRGTPVAARAQMTRALLAAPGFGLAWWREHQEEVQELWRREEHRALWGERVAA